MSNQELLKAYSSYLPYGVKVVDDEYKDIHTLFTVCSNNSIVVKNNEDKGVDVLIYGDFKLLLRPLSDLTKEIEHNGEMFYPYHKLKLPLDLALNMDYRNINNFPYKVISQMIEWHFDVFDLHSRGLCIYKDEI